MVKGVIASSSSAAQWPPALSQPAPAALSMHEPYAGRTPKDTPSQQTGHQHGRHGAQLSYAAGCHHLGRPMLRPAAAVQRCAGRTSLAAHLECDSREASNDGCHPHRLTKRPISVLHICQCCLSDGGAVLGHHLSLRLFGKRGGARQLKPGTQDAGAATGSERGRGRVR